MGIVGGGNRRSIAIRIRGPEVPQLREAAGESFPFGDLPTTTPAATLVVFALPPADSVRASCLEPGYPTHPARARARASTCCI